MQQDTPTYSPRTTTGFFCPACGASILPSMRLSYPPAAVGKFAPVYRCRCGRHIGEPVSMLQLAKRAT
jgi:hypothetical protein